MTPTSKWNISVHILAFLVHLTIAIWIGDYAQDSPTLPVYNIKRGDPPYNSEDIRGELWISISPLNLIWIIEIITACFEFIYVLMVYFGIYWPYYLYTVLFTNNSDKKIYYPLTSWVCNPVRWLEYSITATLGTISQAIGMGYITRINLFLFSLCGISLQFTGYITEISDDLVVSVPSFILGGIIMSIQIYVLIGEDDDENSVIGDPNECIYVDQTPQKVNVTVRDGHYVFNGNSTDGKTLCLTRGSYDFHQLDEDKYAHPFRIVSNEIKEVVLGSGIYNVENPFDEAYYECLKHPSMTKNITFFSDGCDPYNIKTFDKWDENLVPYTIYYLSFAVNCAAYMAIRKKYNNIFPIIEFVYALLSVSSKAAIAGLVWTTVNQYLEHYSPCYARQSQTYSDQTWDINRRLAMTLPGAGAILIFTIRLIWERMNSNSISNPKVATRLVTSKQLKL